MGQRESKILFRRIVHSYLSSVVSIALVLFLAGVSGILLVNARQVAGYFKENLRLTAILSIEADNEDAEEIARKINRLEYVKEVTTITREQGVEEMKELLGNDFLSVFNSSPIPVSIDIKVNADYVSPDSLKAICDKISRFPSVHEVVYQESLVELLNSNLEKIALIMAVFISILLFISFVLISNTVRLNIYSRRFTIRTMRLVGATKNFIARPFVGQAFFQGLISGLIAVAGLLGMIYALKTEFHQLFRMIDMNTLALIMLSVTAAGVMICMFSTYSTVKRLISLTTDELYF